jgi:hypothetical protein
MIHETYSSMKYNGVPIPGATALSEAPSRLSAISVRRACSEFLSQRGLLIHSSYAQAQANRARRSAEKSAPAIETAKASATAKAGEKTAKAAKTAKAGEETAKVAKTTMATTAVPAPAIETAAPETPPSALIPQPSSLPPAPQEAR